MNAYYLIHKKYHSFYRLKMIFHFAHAVKVTDNASVRKFKMA